HLRQTEPIWWCANEPGVDGYDDDGYWVVTKHADVKDSSRRTNEVFSTWDNTAMPRFAPGTAREIVDVTRFLSRNPDRDDHRKYRRIISKGCTPRNIETMRETRAEKARNIVETAAAEGGGDFITEVASALPLQAIAELIGIPQEDRHQI